MVVVIILDEFDKSKISNKIKMYLYIKVER